MQKLWQNALIVFNSIHEDTSTRLAVFFFIRSTYKINKKYSTRKTTFAINSGYHTQLENKGCPATFKTIIVCKLLTKFPSIALLKAQCLLLSLLIPWQSPTIHAGKLIFPLQTPTPPPTTFKLTSKKKTQDCKYQCCFLMRKVEKSIYSRKVLLTPLTGGLNTAAFTTHHLRKWDLNLSSYPKRNGNLWARTFQTTGQWSKAIISSRCPTRTSLRVSTPGWLRANMAKLILRIIRKEKAKSLWQRTKSLYAHSLNITYWPTAENWRRCRKEWTRLSERMDPLPHREPLYDQDPLAGKDFSGESYDWDLNKSWVA